MESKCGIGGHPLHAILVSFPIALLSVSFVFDLGYVWQRDRLWYGFAFYAMAAGYAGALAAAVPGAVDFFLVVPSRGRGLRAAAAHALLGLGLLLLYGVNLGLRLGAPWDAPTNLWLTLGLSAAGVALLTVAAWFGGELVYRHRIGVHESD